MSSAVLTPRTVVPTDLRWRDAAGQLYTEMFRKTFSYGSQMSVQWMDRGPTFAGTLTARAVKPNFAYQIKLVGRKQISAAARPPHPQKDPEGWSSWQLGHWGRWWCDDCKWNVNDPDLHTHLKQKHVVYGYLLFDFFFTDTNGNAVKPFSLDSTYHVLWRADQRTRTDVDSAILWREVIRGQWGYNLMEPLTAGMVGVFAEGVPNRPLPGQLRLPVGHYSAWLNITEESYHDNLGDNPVEHGGLWAQVLETAVEFEVR